MSGLEAAPSRAAGRRGSRGWPWLRPCLSWLPPAKKFSPGSPRSRALRGQRLRAPLTAPRCPQSCPARGWGLGGAPVPRFRPVPDVWGAIPGGLALGGTVPASRGVPRGVGGFPRWVWRDSSLQLRNIRSQPAVGSPRGSEQWGRGAGSLSLPQHSRGRWHRQGRGCVPARGSATRRHMGPRCPGRTLSLSTLVVCRGCHSPQRGHTQPASE